MYKHLFCIFAALCILAFAACGELDEGEGSSSGDGNAVSTPGSASVPGSAGSGSNASSLAPFILAFPGADFSGGSAGADVTVGNPSTGNTYARYSTSYYTSPYSSMNLYTVNDFTGLTSNCIAYVSPAMVSSAGYSKFSFQIRKGTIKGTPFALAIAFGAGEPAPDSPVFYLRNTIQSPYAAGEWKTEGNWDFTTGVIQFLETTGINNNWQKVEIALPLGFDTQGKLMRIRYYGTFSNWAVWDYYFDDFRFEL
ncbi:MAG: hypothetical protein LBC99_00395 [Spirochaetota bacterium]|nr:hypothetical protein [Spirochaetota bacterium]